jgi:hypothetical protein
VGAGPRFLFRCPVRLAQVGSLWTPGGEHTPAEQGVDDDPAPFDPAADEYDEELDDRLAEAAAEMAEVRRQLAQVPADQVVANHVMGLYELAAIHLSQAPPNFEAASLAIDAMGAVLDGVVGRLGEVEPTLRDAVAQIRLAFVQLKAAR